jgi:hypothetical protein
MHLAAGPSYACVYCNRWQSAMCQSAPCTFTAPYKFGRMQLWPIAAPVIVYNDKYLYTGLRIYSLWAGRRAKKLPASVSDPGVTSYHTRVVLIRKTSLNFCSKPKLFRVYFQVMFHTRPPDCQSNCSHYCAGPYSVSRNLTLRSSC